MKSPIRLGNAVRRYLRFSGLILEPFFGSRDVDDAVDDGVGDVYALGSELSRD